MDEERLRALLSQSTLHQPASLNTRSSLPVHGRLLDRHRLQSPKVGGSQVLDRLLTDLDRFLYTFGTVPSINSRWPTARGLTSDANNTEAAGFTRQTITLYPAASAGLVCLYISCSSPCCVGNAIIDLKQISRWFSRNDTIPAAPPDDVPLGLYLYGDVGTGKTMLMDLFYNTLPPSLKRKRRVHFHAFMIDVHKRLHAAKLAMGHKGGDPILPVARDLANDAYILCFDEFQVNADVSAALLGLTRAIQVTDIADAMILRRLLENLMNYGVVCVITSNRHPDELYKNGIQRSSFIPAIELLKTRFEVTDLDSGTDYRRIPRALSKVYFDPLTPSNALEINKIFNSLTDGDEVVHHRPLSIWGRTLKVPESSKDVAKFRFDDLCGQPLSAADYLEVTKTFPTVFLLDVPKMGLDSKDKVFSHTTCVDSILNVMRRLEGSLHS